MPNQFTWYELMTPDTTAAKQFYIDVVGWNAAPAPNSPIPYTLFTVGGAPMAGMMDLPPNAPGIPPNWMGYVAVADVDATTAKAASLGATVMCEPRDIPDVGRFSCISDPQGAPLGLFQWVNQTPPRDQHAPGGIGWHELATTGWQEAFNFYAEMFGWQKADAMDMGEMGTYQLFTAGGEAIGGMMNRPAGMPVSAWLYYFNVPAADATLSRITAGGGKILNGPMEVPGGLWVGQCLDPQGAVFAIVAPQR